MKPKLNSLPSLPGIYRFYDTKGSCIYVGKAKNLKTRVGSYFVKQTELSPAKQHMVREIADLDIIAVNSEKEALLLEAGLIKKHQPRYNIVLRDDKTWTYIAITEEAFPRIITTHGTKHVKGELYGPYTSGTAARTIVRLIHRILPLRTCKRDLSRLPNGLVCMQYHIGNCLGPCEKLIDKTAYDDLIAKARRILRGEGARIINDLRTRMRHFARDKHFEQAALIRDKIKAWESVYEPQHVVTPERYNRDILGIVRSDDSATITVLQVRRGQIQDKLNYVLNNTLELELSELLESFLTQYYTPTTVKPQELILPLSVRRSVVELLLPMRIIVPLRGSKKTLLRMAEQNAQLHHASMSRSKPLPDALYRIQEALALPRLPRRIEAYDISNIQGSFAVGAMVVAVRGTLAPSEYRIFKIRTVQGPNDVMMLREVLMRRINHPSWGEPDLILLDGGKPQLNMVYPILPTSWKEKVVALAKQEEELFIPGKRASVRLKANDPGLLLLRRIRDEVHRKAIGYYRKTHTKNWKN